MRPAAIASTSAIGTDAALVLPYFSMLTKIFSSGIESCLWTFLMIRRLAWWKTNWSTSATPRPASRRAATAESAICRVAYL